MVAASLSNRREPIETDPGVFPVPYLPTTTTMPDGVPLTSIEALAAGDHRSDEVAQVYTSTDALRSLTDEQDQGILRWSVGVGRARWFRMPKKPKKPRKPKKAVRTAALPQLRKPGVVLEAFGDPDDHLRLSTLIAEVVAKAGDSGPTRRGEARRLTDDRGPRSWRERSMDFMAIASRMPSGAVALRDPDAFAETYMFDRTADWDDVTLCRERGQFFDSLLEPIARGAIWLERTAPDPRFSERLAIAQVSVEDVHDPPDPYVSSVGPDARGALHWLLDKEHLSEEAVDDLIEEGVGPDLDRHLILVTYDHLPPPVRAAAYRLAVLRGEQPLNGVIGPFAVQAKHSAEAVGRPPIEGLLSCGFLRHAPTEGWVRMPRIVRDVILARADAEDPDSVAQDHKLAFTRLKELGNSAGIDHQIELHHHAVHGLLIDDAIRTAKFYVTDLRELATRLSDKEQWEAASKVYREIVRVDPADAYAWEYLGYNLLRDDPQKHKEQIDIAYERAYEIDSTNPLYHGRLLGFRGRIGQDIKAEFERSISLYTWRGLDRFASEVLKGLKRGRRVRIARELIATHEFLIKHSEVRRIMDEGWGPRSKE